MQDLEGPNNTMNATKTLVGLPFFFLFAISFCSLPAKSQANKSARPIVRSESKVCGYELDKTLGARPLTSLEEARRILDEVLDKADIDKKLINLYPAKVGEYLGVACVDNGKTTILFDPGELNKLLNSSASEWVVKSIFAHEAGHHYRNHNIRKPKQGNKELELEADETAGQILAKLGASSQVAREAYRAWIGEDKIYIEYGITEYPLPSQRLEALEKGWRSIMDVNIVWKADDSSLGHNYGHLVNGEWVATPAEANGGTYLAFSPHIKLPWGTYKISFLYRCRSDKRTADDAISFRVTTLDLKTRKKDWHSTVDIPLSACNLDTSISSWIFKVPMTVPGGTTHGFEVYSHRNAEVRLKEIRLEQLDSAGYF
jgi:hypothetical protein